MAPLGDRAAKPQPSSAHPASAGMISVERAMVVAQHAFRRNLPTALLGNWQQIGSRIKRMDMDNLGVVAHDGWSGGWNSLARWHT